MDFGTDFTDLMKRKGGVYPWFRSAGLGYFYGTDITDPNNEDWKGVCNQVGTKTNPEMQSFLLPTQNPFPHSIDYGFPSVDQR